MKSTAKSKVMLAAAAVILVALVMVVPGPRHRVLTFFNLEKAQVEEGFYYTCPMHPDVKLPQPGECPICGMTLVKKEAGEQGQSGRVVVTTQQVQLTGLTTENLRRRRLFKEIDTYGEIDYDETKLGIVSAWVGGRIDKLYVNFTGVTVNKGHPLVYIYSPDLISTEKEYLLALDALRQVKRSGMPEAVTNAEHLVKSSRQRLLWWGLTKAQVDELAREGEIQDHITIYAPMGGTVILKNAYEGMYVKEGDVLFRIADLSRVWLYAEIYEDEIPFLYQARPGDYYECVMHPQERSREPSKCSICGMDLLRTNKGIKVEITTRSFPGETFMGTISFTDPFLNPKTRTVRVRVNIDNPDLKLKPGMYARARIEVPVGEVLAVPENAVIHSGKRKIVLVEEKEGTFRPQPVRLGRLWLNDMEREETEIKRLSFRREALRFHEVLAGLREGEKVVTSGNFLLGSESQLQGALAKMIETTEAEEKAAAAGEARETEAMEGTAPAEEKKAGTEEYRFAEEEKIDKIVDAYTEMAELLAGDRLAGLSGQAEIIVKAAASDPIREAARPLIQAEEKGSLTAAREDFKKLSAIIIAYLEGHKQALARVPVRFYCPMAKAEWLQKGEDKANPYFGAMMLKCGERRQW